MKENIKKLILKKIEHDTPFVFSINGSWGVGKTHFWQKEIVEKNKGKFDSNYCYISLFGKTSVEDIVRELMLELKFNKGGKVGEVIGKFAPFVKKAASLASTFGISVDLNSLSKVPISWLPKKAIVCFDDLERLGEGLSLAEVMGLVSQLKEQMQYKIFLLHNSSQSSHQEEYEKSKEKVVDSEIRFAPSNMEIVNIAANNFDKSDKLVIQEISERCKVLGIDNIRIATKAFEFSIEALGNIPECSDYIRKRIIEAVPLFVFCHFDGSEEEKCRKLPTLDYIRTYKSWNYSNKTSSAESESEKLDKKYAKFLSSMNYLHTDELDAVLLNGVSCGYFDCVVLTNIVNNEETLRESNELRDKHHDAWIKHFRSKLNPNINELKNELTASFQAAVHFVSISNCAQLVNLYESIGEISESEKIIDIYTKKIEDKADIELINFEMMHLNEGCPKLTVRLENIKNRLLGSEKLDVTAFLYDMSQRNGWSLDDEERILKISKAELKKVFIEENGDKISLLSYCLRGRNTTGASSIFKSLASDTESVLKEIYSENPTEILKHQLNILNIKV